MTLPYSGDDILRWLDVPTLRKGEQYLPHVIDAHLQGGMLLAEVQGTRKRPYRVSIDLAASTRTSRSRLHGDCSCPVGHNCKHVAAALIVAMQAPKATPRLPASAQLHSPPARGDLLEHLAMWHSARAQRHGSGRASARAPTKFVPGYVLRVQKYRLSITAVRTQHDASGRLVAGQPLPMSASRLLTPPPGMEPLHRTALYHLWLLNTHEDPSSSACLAPALQAVLDTGSAFIPSADGMGKGIQPARPGGERKGTLQWAMTDTSTGALPAPALQVDGDALGFVQDQYAGYVDLHTGEVGPVLLPVATDDADDFLTLPPLLPSERRVTAQLLAAITPGLPHPPLDEPEPVVLPSTEMIPWLDLHSVETHAPWMKGSGAASWADLATVRFDYGGHAALPGEQALFGYNAEGELGLLLRDVAAEQQRQQQLYASGLILQPNQAEALAGLGPNYQLRGNGWQRFLQEQVPQLQALGWNITFQEGFRHQVTVVDSISLQIDPANGENDGFAVGLDIEVDGQRVALAALLHDLLNQDPRWTRGSLDAIDDAALIVLTTADKQRIGLRADRLKPVVALLGDLLAGSSGGQVRVPARDSGRLRALQDQARLQFRSSEDTQAMVQRLFDGPRLHSVVPPAGLRATMRSYQLEGLAWLQYLRQQGLGGILADDMGLGKTLQTLAHVLLEKEAGRLDRPALVVVPTSLLGNWQTEAARFTPDLRVLVLHGNSRDALFAQIPRHDLVLTTYPLLWRDVDVLRDLPFHLLILDEAQQVKNPKSRAAVALRSLDSRHRLCLTGTPLENHLGELWSHFDFLLPGLLGTEKVFNQHWRTPIERDGDQQRTRVLAQRVGPFLLRRTKDQVAKELPPRTTIIRSVVLEGGQRDLYETVRAAMQEKVTAAIAHKGLAKSHIVVLDALLKLRQVCCDPRLLAGEHSARPPASAKLELLREIIPEMVEEGRRILLFSQFTSMLALIAEALDELGIAYVKLTGQTKDRATPVQRFMQGEVPVFLISLKAGGVGLNLTAADTVIHFDPWWNPAAEEQASDRAHRIGQDKPVFVYKLIAAGSIEERIAELQQRKAALAGSILDGGQAAGPRFSDSDLQALLAPLPGPAPRPAPRAKRRTRTE